MTEGWISRACLASLAFTLLIGTCEANDVAFNKFLLHDGETRSSCGYGNYHPRLILQEGAIVDVVCKTNKAIRRGPLSAVGVKWALQTHTGTGNNHQYEELRFTVDDKVFPDERNYEKYHSEYVDGPSFDKAVKVMSTLRYTARKEDHGKGLVCEGVDLNGGSSPDVSSYYYVGNHLHLVIRPAPAPLTFKSTIVHKWRSGFVGRIDIPISDYYTSWKIIITFPRKVFNLFGGAFQVANEPCLHAPDCGDDVRKQWVIYQTFANRVQNPGDHLRLTFVAKVWKKIDQGLLADVDFYGYNQVFFTHVSSADISSSSDIHVI
ncbi:uncharacterized protein [Amphiura filiformis]|uniref:uncharacterized protein n=1 Tax=Amphiura filiformis TaxID=82378 RepID=UPI003B20BFD7